MDSNRVRMLDAIRRGKNSFSKKDLHRETEIAWGTMCKVVDTLVAEGDIFARREEPSGRGRPMIPYCVNPDAMRFVGIDVGADSTKTVVCDLTFNTLYRSCDRTPKYQGQDAFLHWLFGVFDGAMAGSGTSPTKLRGVGLSVSGNVDSEAGVLVSGGNFGLKWGASIPVAQALSEHAGAPVRAMTTTAAAVWGEYHFGARAGCGDLVTILLGVGIGSGVVSNHQLLISQPGRPVGYIGHLLMPDNKNLCACGFRGCIESFSGGKALGRDAHALDLAADDGDPEAAALLRKAASYNALGVANMIQLYSPEALVFAGGQARKDGFLYQATLDALDEILPDERRRRVVISLSTLGPEQSALGAARLAYESFF